MNIRLLLTSIALIFSLSFSQAFPQEKSVKPGINDSFRDPNVQEFQGRFEVESREVFHRRKEIVAACGIQPGMTIADIGAGTGLFTRLFSEAVGEEGQVVAVDIAQKFLDHIERTSREAGQQNIKTLLCTPDSIELPPDSVDLAFICDTYHHFEFPLKTMGSIHRALKPGGRVVVIDFRRISGKSKEWTLNHVRAGQEVFESEIVQSGFLKTGEPEGLLEENYFVQFSKSATPGLLPLEYPLLKQNGGIVSLPEAVEQPLAGASIVFDITADSPPTEINKGLERAARLINLYGAAGLKPADVKLTLVLHGGATKSILQDEFYVQRFGTKNNPNLPLICELQGAGVEIVVCGQAMNYKGFPSSAMADKVSVAVAALTAIVNRQMDGYAYIPVP